MRTDSAFHSIAQDFRSVRLAHAGTELTLLPDVGGKISALVLGGRDWLWRSDVLPVRLPVAGTSYVKTADSGGFDECFPTVGPCTLPAQLGGVELPDHGELWSQACTVAQPDARTATCTWTTRKLPARFERTLRVLDDGTVRMDYRVTNTGKAPLPFVWSSHPLFRLWPGTRVRLPEGARMRVFAAHVVDVDQEHRWPWLRLANGTAMDLSAPADVRGTWAVKVFVDMPEGRCALEQDGHALVCTWDAREVPNVGLWINHLGWTPFDDAEPYLNLALEPCIGAPDTLSDALTSWRAAHWLDAGSTRTWSLTWSATDAHR
jgi:galactose mutarotase-like enzyme